MQDCWLHSLPLILCHGIILEADLPLRQDFWLHTFALFLGWVISAEADLPCPHIQACRLFTLLLFVCRAYTPDASFHRNCGNMHGQPGASTSEMGQISTAVNLFACGFCRAFRYCPRPTWEEDKEQRF